jgi:hypothetical protein
MNITNFVNSVMGEKVRREVRHDDDENLLLHVEKLVVSQSKDFVKTHYCTFKFE